MREFKFRAWDGSNWFFFGLLDAGSELPAYPGAAYNVMQYTGLRDKKRTTEFPDGQEVYEGDLVRVTESENPMSWIAKVENIGWHGYRLESVEQANWFEDNADPQQLEVIGNIYENPESSQPAKT